MSKRFYMYTILGVQYNVLHCHLLPLHWTLKDIRRSSLPMLVTYLMVSDRNMFTNTQVIFVN